MGPILFMTENDRRRTEVIVMFQDSFSEGGVYLNRAVAFLVSLVALLAFVSSLA